jgi:hypothetical protein
VIGRWQGNRTLEIATLHASNQPERTKLPAMKRFYSQLN